jgi:hypothetical protein
VHHRVELLGKQEGDQVVDLVLRQQIGVLVRHCEGPFAIDPKRRRIHNRFPQVINVGHPSDSIRRNRRYPGMRWAERAFRAVE